VSLYVRSKRRSSSGLPSSLPPSFPPSLESYLGVAGVDEGPAQHRNVRLPSRNHLERQGGREGGREGEREWTSERG